VLGDEPLPVTEIVPADEFYSYDAKYRPGGSRHICPAPIDHDLAARLQVLAISIHRMLGLRDYSRSDFIVSKEGRPYILEVNALPGLTPTSLIPEECAAIGIGYDALIERLINAALSRGAAYAESGVS
jgi:D-alanine-D-alanine ligase